MEVSRPLYSLSEARDRLIHARVEIDRFDNSVLEKTLQEGTKIAFEAESSGWKALDELAYRRKGLALSAAILMSMMVLLILKIRRLPTIHSKSPRGAAS
jgi:hypothetical protein